GSRCTRPYRRPLPVPIVRARRAATPRRRRTELARTPSSSRILLAWRSRLSLADERAADDASGLQLVDLRWAESQLAEQLCVVLASPAGGGVERRVHRPGGLAECAPQRVPLIIGRDRDSDPRVVSTPVIDASSLVEVLRCGDRPAVAGARQQRAERRVLDHLL